MNILLASSIRTKSGLSLLGLSLGLAFSLSCGAWAADDLTSFEQQLFSHDYQGEPLSQRLGRLEASVFGEPQAGSETERKGRLLNVLSAARRVIPTVESRPATQPAESPAGITQFSPLGAPGANAMADPNNEATYAPPAPPPGDTDYPTVTALEREVFGRDFIREDVSHRLGRLEKKVF